MPALIFAEVILPETTMETAPAQQESSHHQDQEPAMLSPNYARTTRKSLEENALMYAMVILPELPKETAPAHKESSHHQDQEPAMLHPILPAPTVRPTTTISVIV